jgi:hypothetical protein
MAVIPIAREVETDCLYGEKECKKPHATGYFPTDGTKYRFRRSGSELGKKQTTAGKQRI